MNPEQMQQPNSTADKSAAALAFATMLSEQFSKQNNPPVEQNTEEQSLDLENLEPSQTPETAPGEEIVPESEEMAMETIQDPMEEMKKEMSSFKDEVRTAIEEGIESVKKLFKDGTTA